MKKKGFILAGLWLCLAAACTEQVTPIDRQALVERNSPHIIAVDTMASLNVGNGDFSVTVDVTGLQSFPELYKNGVPLGTMSSWGWHCFPNTENLRPEETLAEYDFGHGHKELYATQFKEKGRQNDASNYFRVNPHRLHLGVVGFDFQNNPWRQRTVDSQKVAADEMLGPGQGVGKGDVAVSDNSMGEYLLSEECPIKNIDQTLELWTGKITSRFSYDGVDYEVETVCNPRKDMVSAKIKTAALTPICLRFPYPTGAHSDDACDWNQNEKHSTRLVSKAKEEQGGTALLERQIDETRYWVAVRWHGAAELVEADKNYFILTPETEEWNFSVEYVCDEEAINNVSKDIDFDAVAASSADVWSKFWKNTGVVDFSECTDARAPELERRVILSEWLLATQCAGATPPQETGLTYNSWFGKYHLEMIWWHQSWLPLYNHPKKAARTLKWYESAEPMARQIAERQGFKGVRWMKMTDPSAIEAPSKVGSFLIWQQPHYIYLSELMRRTAKTNGTDMENYSKGSKDADVSRLIQETAEFMADFATKEELSDGGYRYVLKGAIPAQETLKAAETVNSPFELSYWHFALSLAQKDLEAHGQPRNPLYDDIIEHLAPLAYTTIDGEKLYLAAETALDTYTDVRFTSDHMAVLGAIGILPDSRLVDKAIMRNTFNWIWDNWNWDKTWGWDHPMTAMCAARLGMPDKAVDALLMDKRTNTYLPNGHNYQDQRLRCYLPGNGGLLTAIAMMCAGWDGCSEKNPGFPKDGTWNVKWENIHPMP